MITPAWLRGSRMEIPRVPKRPRRNRRRGRTQWNPGLGWACLERLEDRALLAGGAPDITPHAATSITSSSAMANAEINAENSNTTVSLVFSLDPALAGNTTMSNVLTILPAQTDETIIGSLTGLQPDTTYYYRFVAANAAGTTNGQILSFTTLAGPPTVNSSGASNISSTSGTFNASVSSGGNDTSVTFVYGTDSTLTTGTLSTAPQNIGSGAAAVNVSASVTGLHPGTAYYVEAIAQNSAGTSKSQILSFNTGTGTGAGLPVLTNESSTGITSNSAALSVTANPEGADTTLALAYGTDPTLTSGTTNTQFSIDLGSGTSDIPGTFHAPDLTPNTTYYFRYSASNSAGTTRAPILHFTTLAAPPGATTAAATLIATTTATLGGTVNPEAAGTTVTFIYGTDANLATGTTTTTAQDAGSGAAAVGVTAPLAGLTPNTTYYFQVVATNTAGTTKGSILNFTTLAAPPVATTAAATSVTTTTATLGSNVNPEAADTTVTFVYGTDPNLATGTTTTAAQSAGAGPAAVSVTAPLVALTPNTSYYFQVVATNKAGTTKGSILPFTTVAAPPGATTATATSITTTTATLSSTVNPEAADTTVDFIFGTDSQLATGTTTTPSGDIGSGAAPVTVHAPLQGLTPNTTYFFQLVASNSAGTTRGSILSFTTLAAPPGATTAAATSITGTTATFKGSVNPEAADTTVTFVYGTDPNLASGTTTTASTDAGAGSAPTMVATPVANLTAGTTYYFQVVATNKAGTTRGMVLSFTTAAGTAPTANTGRATQVNSTSATLEATVNPNGAATSVTFVYGTDPTLMTGTTTTKAQAIGSGTSDVAVSAAVSGLTPDTIYYFKVVASSSGGTNSGRVVDFLAPTNAAAPGVVTEDGAADSFTTATLDGTVDPNGFSTDTFFQYSTDPTLPPNYVSPVAGLAGQSGNVDGLGSAARFSSPSDLAFDPRGNLYVADQGNGEIRMITPNGVVSTVAGAPGTSSAGMFFGARGLAVDQNGNIFVADTGINKIYEITPDGTITLLAGSGEAGLVDGVGADASFYQPEGLAVDDEGNLFVADTQNGAIRVITSDGVVSTLGDPPGPNRTLGVLHQPSGIAINAFGDIFVTDVTTVDTIDLGGNITILAGIHGQSGQANGTGPAAQFEFADGVTVDAAGNLYITDINASTIRKITPDGVVTTLVGLSDSGGAARSRDGFGQVTRFSGPSGLTIDAAGSLYVADQFDNQIRKVSIPTVTAEGGLTGNGDVAVSAVLGGLAPGTTYYFRAAATNAGGTGLGEIEQFTTPSVPTAPVATTQPASAVTGTAATLAAMVNPNGSSTNITFQYSTDPNLEANVTTLAGSGVLGAADGTGTAASFYEPNGIAVDAQGNVYVADTYADTIRKITPAGVVTTLAGVPYQPGYVNGPAAKAQFNQPSGVAVDSAGNVYVADWLNGLVRKITPDGMVSTLAGGGLTSGADGNATDASFFGAQGVAVDAAGNVLVAEGFDIRKISADGVVTTLAGNGVAGLAENVLVPGTVASVRFPGAFGVAVDPLGNVYVSGYSSAVFRFTAAGAAGQFEDVDPFVDQSGASAQGVAVDAAGNIYVADRADSKIYEFTAAGAAMTLAGNGALGYTDGPGSNAVFRGPLGLAVDRAGNVYVADTGNSVIRKLTIPTIAAQSGVTGTSAVAGSATLAGLAPGTKYYYRVTATNAGGETYGAIQSFTTPALPVVVTQAASAVNATAVTVNATVNPEGNTASATFIFGTDPALGTGTTTTSAIAIGQAQTPIPVTTAITALLPGTTYYYKVVASGPGGSAIGAVLSFKTPILAPVATTQPATAVTTTTAFLTASVNPEGSPVSANFVFGTDPSLGTGTSTTSAVAIGQGQIPILITTTISALIPGTTYYYKVVASGPGGPASGAVLSFQTPVAAPVATTQAATAVTTTTASLAASVNPEGSPVSANFVFGTDPSLSAGTAATSPFAIGPGTQSVAVTGSLTGLMPGTTYYFRVVATGPGGTTTGAIEQLKTTSDPAVVEFAFSQIAANLGDGSVSVGLTRTGDLTTTVTTVVSSPGGPHVAPFQQTATFAPGASTTKVTLPIQNNGNPGEPDTSVTLALSSPSAGATLGFGKSLVVVVHDNNAFPPAVAVASLHPTTVRITMGTGRRAKVKTEPGVVIQFTGALTGTSNPNAYQLFTGKAKKGVTTFNQRLPLSVSNAGPTTVTIATSANLKLSQPLQLRLTNSALTDAYGRPLNGGKAFTISLGNKTITGASVPSGSRPRMLSAAAVDVLFANQGTGRE